MKNYELLNALNFLIETELKHKKLKYLDWNGLASMARIEIDIIESKE